MKKTKLTKFLAASATFLLLAGGCNNEPSASTSTSTSAPVTIPAENIVFDETKTDTVNLGDSYYLEPLVVKGSDNKAYKAVITVKDSEGKDYPVVDSAFTPDHTGTYTITYTITYGDNQTIERSYTITVVDLSAPVISSAFAKDNLIMLGETVDLSSVTVVDNSKEDITPQVSVTFNGEAVELTDNAFVASEKGTYSVNVVAEDSTGNKLEDSFYIYTVVDGDSGVAPVNQYYPMSLGEEGKSYNGEKAIKAEWFYEHPEWVNDFSLLGSDFNILTEAKYLSFWIYFDSEVVGTELLYNIYKHCYYQTYCYDEYGVEVPEYYQFPNSFELASNKWYRMVFDLTDATNISAEGRECEANPKSMAEVAMGFGVWDPNIQGNARQPQTVYLDDIRLTNALDDEVYHTVPVIESNYIPNESKATVFTNASLYDAQKAANGEWITSHELINYTVAHGTKDSYSPLVTNSVDTLGATAESVSGENGAVEYANWRMFFNKNDGVVYAATAKKHSFVKIEEHETAIGGWVEAKLEYVVLDASGTQKSINSKTINDAASAVGNVGCEYVELQEGETFLFVVTSLYDATRNMQFCPSLVVAPAKDKNATSTYGADTENVTALNNASLYDAQKAANGAWITSHSLVDYTVAHGTKESYSPLVTNSVDTLGATAESVSGENGAVEYANWRMFFNKNDGVVYAVEAKEHCFVRVAEFATSVGGWVEAKLEYVVLDASGTQKSINTKTINGAANAFGNMACDYVELQEGETFLFVVTSLYDATRNMQGCPGLEFAPAIEL